MLRKIQEYNTYLETSDCARLGISYREVRKSPKHNCSCTTKFNPVVKVNGRLVLEGVLRVFWGVAHSIRLREYDDQRPIAKGRDRTSVPGGETELCQDSSTESAIESIRL